MQDLFRGGNGRAVLPVRARGCLRGVRETSQGLPHLQEKRGRRCEDLEDHIECYEGQGRGEVLELQRCTVSTDDMISI